MQRFPVRRLPSVVHLLLLTALCLAAACSDDNDVDVDAPIDSPCASCRSDQICLASYDGTCKTSGPRCVDRTVDCPNNACSAACQSAYCSAPYQCETRSPCGGEPPDAFTCYGP